ncbi:peroxisomal biogenesis factor 19-like [Ylistrum balloti]|uniref:peroxisomal biogenesis factor 19-like n=1 Tax=Ylistrum balloti TaxID=509963 RepID=UPI00290599CF|nr:peroxisomal biogenesis factor 19-like [Ylistrum balloti]
MAEQTPTTNVEVNESVKKTIENGGDVLKNTDAKAADGNGVDKELDDLLDSALEDFEKPVPVEKPTVVMGKSGGVTPSGEAKSSEEKTDPMSELFAEEFSDEMAKQFEDAMKNIMGNEPGLMQQIEKLAESANSAGDSAEAQKEFANTLSQTLSSLAQNSEGLGDEMSEEELMKAFTSMGLEEGQDGFMPMMQGMMKNLLSKDVLYPSLKEMSQKYPKWLEENQEKTEKTQLDKYQSQLAIIQDICEEFEKEKDSETEEVKKLRFERIVDKMQKMQELGQPPKDIVGDMAPGLDFDENGMPKLPGTQDGQCAVM